MWIFRHLRSALAVLLLTAAAFPALAANFYEKNGAALGGHDPVAYFTDGKPVLGNAAITHVYKGATFHFASAANRDAFAAQPERYAPQYGGYCAYGLTRGYKAATDPASFAVVDGKLYLNYNREVQTAWSADAKGNIVKADAKWPEVAKTTKVIE
jgi:YHS domain-containing protein